jgi:glyoxylate reductase
MMLLGNDVYGATLGVIGMGRIGSAVAQRAKGFSMRILYADVFENETTRNVEREFGASRTDLETLLREADIVTIHVPLNPDTREMIGEKELSMMKPGAVLVNTSRGAVINESALADALRSGHLRGPHIASASFATRARMATICAESLIAALRGERPPNVVNREVFDVD